MKLLFSILFTLFLVSCSDSIKSECEIEITPDDRMKASFSEIQEKVFKNNCAISGCHGQTLYLDPQLTVSTAYDNLINVSSLQNPDMPYVDPGNSANSWIMFKILGQGTSIMPPSGKLSQTVIDSIAAWIDAGAPNN